MYFMIILFLAHVKERTLFPDKFHSHPGAQALQILGRTRRQDTIAATGLTLEHDLLAAYPRHDVLAAAGADELTAVRQVMHAIQCLQERLLALQVLIAIIGMQRIILGGIEVQELGDILPLANVSQLKMIVFTVEFFKTQMAQLTPGELLLVLPPADTAGSREYQSLTWFQRDLSHCMPAAATFQREMLLPTEKRHIMELNPATALAVKRQGTGRIDKHRFSSSLLSLVHFPFANLCFLSQ